MRPLRLSALAVTLVLAGCHPRADVVRASTSPVGSAAPAATTGYLVWTHADDGSVHTALVDETSKVLAEADTAVFASAGRTFALGRTPSTRRLGPCELVDADLGPSTSEALSLVALDGDEAARTVVPDYFARPSTGHDGHSPDVGNLMQTVDVVGSLGPYLFIRESLWSFACGAHGGWERDSLVVDVRTGDRVSLPLADGRAAEATARTQFVAMAKESADVGTLWNDGQPGELVHAALEPRFEDGQLGLVHVFLADACYACGNSAWRSYTVETELPAVPPPELAERLGLPPAVRAYIERLAPVVHFGGFTETDDPLATSRKLSRAHAVAPHAK